jgi:hypothetical protein
MMPVCAAGRPAGAGGRVLSRRETRQCCGQMLIGLLMELDDHNCWTIAEAVGHYGPHRLQRSCPARRPVASERPLSPALGCDPGGSRRAFPVRPMPAVPMAENAAGTVRCRRRRRARDRYRPSAESMAMALAIVRRSSFLTRYSEPRAPATDGLENLFRRGIPRSSRTDQPCAIRCRTAASPSGPAQGGTATSPGVALCRPGRRSALAALSCGSGS